MKKKLSFILLLTLGYTSFIFLKTDNKFSSNNTKTNTPVITEHVEKDVSTNQFKISHNYSYLNSKILNHTQWKNFINYTSQSEFIYKNPKEVTELARLVIKNVSACLKKDLCHQTKSPNSPYFDAKHTPAHNLIERALSLLIEMKEERISDFDEISKNELLEILKIDNEAIQGLGLELILAKSPSDSELIDLVSKVEAFDSNVLGQAYGMLYSVMKESPEEREILISSVEKSLKSNDSYRSIELAKNLKYLELNQNEFENMLESNCQKQRETHNQKAIEFYIKDAAKANKFELKTKCS